MRGYLAGVYDDLRIYSRRVSRWMEKGASKLANTLFLPIHALGVWSLALAIVGLLGATRGRPLHSVLFLAPISTLRTHVLLDIWI